MANVGDEFPTTLEVEDLPPGGITVKVTKVWQQDMLNYDTNTDEPTWCIAVDSYPYKVIKMTPGRGKTMVRLFGPETDDWLHKAIRLVRSTNAAPGGKKYVVIEEASESQAQPPENPPDTNQTPPPPEEGENEIPF